MTSLYRITPDGDHAGLHHDARHRWKGIAGLSTDAAGNLYVLVSETDRKLVKIAPDLTMTTVAQVSGYAMVGDSAGNQYISDLTDNQILESGCRRAR